MADHTQHPSLKGKDKGKDTTSPSEQQDSSSSKPSLLRSALGGTSEITASLGGILSSQGKADQASSSSQTEAATRLASDTARPSSSTSPTPTSGPRQGFRTSQRDHTTSGPGPSASDLIQPFLAVDLRNSDLESPRPRYDSFEALDRGLHDYVRDHTLSHRDERQSSHDHPSSQDLLDPAYHEAWARSIPSYGSLGGGADHLIKDVSSEKGQSEALVKAWEEALSTGGKREQHQQGLPTHPFPAQATSTWWPEESRPAPRRTAEEGGFMDLLAAEEAEEQRRLAPSDPSEESKRSISRPDRSRYVEEAEAYQPAPEPRHALQSTDPREALSFLLDSPSSSRVKWQAELAELKDRLERTNETSSQGGGDANATRNGLDRTSTRVMRRAQLARIEYDLSVLEGKIGYHEEVNAPYAGVAYADPPDLSKLVNDEEEKEEEETEKEMEQRRKRAIERLESLRRHLDAKL